MYLNQCYSFAIFSALMIVVDSIVVLLERIKIVLSNIIFPLFSSCIYLLQCVACRVKFTAVALFRSQLS